MSDGKYNGRAAEFFPRLLGVRVGVRVKVRVRVRSTVRVRNISRTETSVEINFAAGWAAAPIELWNALRLDVRCTLLHYVEWDFIAGCY